MFAIIESVINTFSYNATKEKAKIPYSLSFLVRYRKTYIFNNINMNKKTRIYQSYIDIVKHDNFSLHRDDKIN